METLRVMSSLAMQLALEHELLPRWQTSTRRASVSWGPTKVLVERIDDGVRGDVLIAVDETITDLTDRGVLRRGSCRPLARASFGLGTRIGAVCPDISTPLKFRDALLSAASVAYSETGASGIHFRQVIEDLGITEAVNERATVIHSGFTADMVLGGEADLAVQQISELMRFEDIEVVGPFPKQHQKHTEFAAAIFCESSHPELANDFIGHLTTPAAASVYTRSGLAPRNTEE